MGYHKAFSWIISDVAHTISKVLQDASPDVKKVILIDYKNMKLGNTFFNNRFIA